MITRIVCTHDATKLAETLRRLLEAEQHPVCVSVGRHSIDAFESARTSNEAVLLIWSDNAPGAHYMLDWATRFDPARLIEIAAVSGWPDLDRREPVIDFAHWSGSRGDNAWSDLIERLDDITLATAPPKLKAPPPRRAAAALVIASAAAMIGALAIRMHSDVVQPPAPPPTDEPMQAALDTNPNDGVGGPLVAIEPASVEDELTAIDAPHDISAPRLDIVSAPVFTELPEIHALSIRNATLLEQLSALNPMRRQDDGANN
jgi:hypothetical protein